MYFNSKLNEQNTSVAHAVTITAGVVQTKPSNEPQWFKISLYDGCFDKHPRPEEHTWVSFCKEFQKHPIRLIKDGPAWSPASIVENGTRKNEFVDHVYFAVIDVDGGLPHQDLVARFKACPYT